MEQPKIKSFPLVLRGRMTTQKSSCWSITINNPTAEEVKCVMPGWTLQGQYEVGKEGTRHFQGMLKTPHVRFSAIKKMFPRAHIEVARKPEALEVYVHKEDTRESEYTQVSTPNIFMLQTEVASLWDAEVWSKMIADCQPGHEGDMALSYVDTIVSTLITEGAQGIEFTAVNPMWRSSWKRFWRAIVARQSVKDRQTDSQQPESVPLELNPPSPPALTGDVRCRIVPDSDDEELR